MIGLGGLGKVFRKIFGSRNERLLKAYQKRVEVINELEPRMRGEYDTRFAAEAMKLAADMPAEDKPAAVQRIRVELSADLRQKTEELRERLAKGEDVYSVLPEAFAACREASRRAQNHRHFDCQLIGGQVLFEGKIAEMKTGEGKTIVCHLPAYLKALQGKKVHTVTVNDYLVQRDAEFARPIFELLGMTVGYIQSQVDPGGHEGIRKKAYACNITYGTNNEFGFDYLRDNMKIRLEDQAQGRLDFAIVDEVDSILIDEARTPLIISGPAGDDVTRYRTANDVAKVIIQRQTIANNESNARIKGWGDNPPKENRDHPKFENALKRFKTDPFWITEDEGAALGHKQYFVVQRERKSVALTHDGISVAQDQLGLGSLYVGSNMEWPHLLENAVRAHMVYERDVDYVVKDGEVIIVDSFTGRLMHGRQWSDGLHQAVEAKEGVRVKEETQTLATITLQNFFKMYSRIAGMTGTAMTEADEFMKIYKLEVVAIPTNRPVNREDHNDRIYKTVDDKYEAIVEEIHDIHTKGRPADPFVLEPILKNLIPIMQKQSRSTELIDRALAEFNDGKYGGEIEKKARAKDGDNLDEHAVYRDVTRLMAEAYDDAMGDLAKGRPILVGTISIENSEKLSNLLTKRYGIEHEVLNAKQHAREAEIVKKAGEAHESVRGREKQNVGNVTIATNMAGRGTDIKLQLGVVYPKCVGDLGSPPNGDGRHFGWHETGVVGTKCCIHCPDYDPKTNCAHCWKPKVDPRFPELGRKVCTINSPCGLHIVGTERHESRRIDNQLRGRSGRQGDPGSSRFFLSLKDDLLKLFMGDWMLKMLEKTGFEEGMAMEHKMLNRGIEKAQKKVEEKNFSARKHLLEYDEVMDHQRQVFYTQRQEILAASRPGKSEALVKLIWRMIDDVVRTAADKCLADDYRAQCVAEWVKAELECPIDPKVIDVDSPVSLERYVRDSAKEEASNQIKISVGEYMDPDVEPADWDIRGLARWAETRFGANISQNQLKTMQVEQVTQLLIEAAERKVDEADLKPLERFTDPQFGTASLLLWVRQKFGLEFAPEEFAELSRDDLTHALEERIREAYRQREVAVPVEHALESTVLQQGAIDDAYAVDALAQWVNLKFNLGWTVDNIRNRPLKDVSNQLFALSRDYYHGGKLEEEIDKALGLRQDAREWGRKRFGPAFDEETFDKAASPREALVMFGRDLLRRELTMLERYVLLQIYDQTWKEHMHAMDILKDSIGLRGYAEQDPKIAYKREGFKIFEETMDGIQERVTSIIFRARMGRQTEERQRLQATGAHHADSTNLGFSAQASADRQAAMQAQGQEKKVETIRREQPRVGRNEPCPCGSGKKYKQCHGKGA